MGVSLQTPFLSHHQDAAPLFHPDLTPGSLPGSVSGLGGCPRLWRLYGGGRDWSRPSIDGGGGGSDDGIHSSKQIQSSLVRKSGFQHEFSIKGEARFRRKVKGGSKEIFC